MDAHPASPQQATLYLRGVSLSDRRGAGGRAVEDLFDERLLQAAGGQDDQDAGAADCGQSSTVATAAIAAAATSDCWTRLPAAFTTLAAWPESVRLCCCGCLQQIRGRPWFVQKAEKLEAGYCGRGATAITPEGAFCGPSCASGFIERAHSRDLVGLRAANAALADLYGQFTGRVVRSFRPAPSYLQLRQFGGSMSAAELAQAVAELDARLLAESFPLADASAGTPAARAGTVWAECALSGAAGPQQPRGPPQPQGPTLDSLTGALPLPAHQRTPVRPPAEVRSSAPWSSPKSAAVAPPPMVSAAAKARAATAPPTPTRAAQVASAPTRAQAAGAARAAPARAQTAPAAPPAAQVAPPPAQAATPPAPAASVQAQAAPPAQAAPTASVQARAGTPGPALTEAEIRDLEDLLALI